MKSVQQVVFLDTSIQIQRILKDEAQTVQIESTLASSSITGVTSNYVWMEYQRSVVTDYAHVYSVMRQYMGWGKMFRNLLDGPRAYRPRAAARCTQIVGRIYEESDADYKLARHILAELIARGLKERFWTHVSSLSDPISCDLVKPGVKRHPKGDFAVPSSCRKDSATCHLPTFLHKNHTKLQILTDYLAAHPRAIKDQTRVERLLSSILDDPRNALGQAACWPLGDIIIALQVPDKAQLWTLDADFGPIAELLGVDLYRFVG